MKLNGTNGTRQNGYKCDIIWLARKNEDGSNRIDSFLKMDCELSHEKVG